MTAAVYALLCVTFGDCQKTCRALALNAPDPPSGPPSTGIGSHSVATSETSASRSVEDTTVRMARLEATENVGQELVTRGALQVGVPALVDWRHLSIRRIRPRRAACFISGDLTVSYDNGIAGSPPVAAMTLCCR